MQKTVDNINNKIKQLKIQFGTKELIKRRFKRGMFDTIRETKKKMFEVMDHDYANYYYDKIKEVSHNQYELSK